MRGLLILVFLLSGLAAHAVGVVVKVGFADAGRNLSDITGHQNYEIAAGKGFQGTLGALIPITPTQLHRFELEANIGVLTQGDTRPGEDNAIFFDRWPLELLYFYRNTQEDFRIGYGPILHLMNKLRGKGATAGATTDFDNAFGWSIEADKLFKTTDGPGFLYGIGIKYNFIRYYAPGSKEYASGNSLFVTLSTIWL